MAIHAVVAREQRACCHVADLRSRKMEVDFGGGNENACDQRSAEEQKESPTTNALVRGLSAAYQSVDA